MTLAERVATLAERCQAGDQDALAELMTATHGALLRAARLRQHDAMLAAADVLQEVYWRYWTRCSRVPPTATLYWLIRVACNVRCDALKKERLHLRVSLPSSEAGVLWLSTELMVDDPYSPVLAFLRSLDVRRRYLCVLLAEGFSQTEAASVLGVSRARVTQLLSPIRQRLAM